MTTKLDAGAIGHFIRAILTHLPKNCDGMAPAWILLPAFLPDSGNEEEERRRALSLCFAAWRVVLAELRAERCEPALEQRLAKAIDDYSRWGWSRSTLEEVLNTLRLASSLNGSPCQAVASEAFWACCALEVRYRGFGCGDKDDPRGAAEHAGMAFARLAKVRRDEAWEQALVAIIAAVCPRPPASLAASA
jgi:hypothetical protein